jgi:hypothetical protein
MGATVEADELNLDRIKLQKRSSDPAAPPAGESVTWMSDGTDTGNAGDILTKTTKADGNTKTINRTNFSEGRNDLDKALLQE